MSIRTPNYTLQDLAGAKKEYLKEVKKSSMQLWIYRKKGWRQRKKVVQYVLQRKDINNEYVVIYHCGDVSGEVPPVLIPNTEVKLTSAENTGLETVREDRLLLHPVKKVLLSI